MPIPVATSDQAAAFDPWAQSGSKLQAVPTSAKRSFVQTAALVNVGSLLTSDGFGQMTCASPNQTFDLRAGLAGQRDFSDID